MMASEFETYRIHPCISRTREKDAPILFTQHTHVQDAPPLLLKVWCKKIYD